jgi:4-hydroxy-tetrahydrodipicolinate synthase
MKELIGTGVALVTPFKEDRSIDVSALQGIVEYCIQGGVDYLVVLGTTGESVTLNMSEKRLVVNTVITANADRLPMVLGVGGNNTAAVIEELLAWDLSKFVAVLSVSPYYNRPTQEGIYQHFKAIAKVSPKPLIVYNVPGRTGSNMLPETTLRLAIDCDNIIAIKEACGDLDQIVQLVQKKPPSFQVISGDDATALSTVLAGGVGVISVIGQGLPKIFSKMIALGLEGLSDDALKLEKAMIAGMDLIFQEGNPAGVKAMLETLGYGKAWVRLPLVEATPQLKGKIASFMESMERVTA